MMADEILAKSGRFQGTNDARQHKTELNYAQFRRLPPELSELQSDNLSISQQKQYEYSIIGSFSLAFCVLKVLLNQGPNLLAVV